MSRPGRGLGSRSISSKAFAKRSCTSRGRWASSRSAERLIRIWTNGYSLSRFRTSFQSENSSSLSLRRCSRTKPAGGRSSMRSFRTSSYVAPPTLYARRRAQVSLFTGIVVVGITIDIIKLIVLIVVARWCKSGSMLDWRAVLALSVRPEVPPRVPERPQLRRLLDGVGEPRADADREALGDLPSPGVGTSPRRWRRKMEPLPVGLNRRRILRGR